MLRFPTWQDFLALSVGRILAPHLRVSLSAMRRMFHRELVVLSGPMRTRPDKRHYVERQCGDD